MSKKISLWAALLVAVSPFLYGQSFEEFSVRLEQMNLPDMPGVHSYAIGNYDGIWVILGGRIDGLHDHRPPFSFGEPGENTFITVVSPQTSEVWSSPLSGLPATLEEQMSSSNMQFVQLDSILVLAGGYGYSDLSGDHITFPNLTILDLPGVIEAVMTGAAVSPWFTQIEDERMAVSGGHLSVKDDTLLLVMGHKFDGRYNPHDGPSFVQTYTHAIRSFTLDLSDTPVIDFYNEVLNEEDLHRRDYNLHPQIGPEGEIYFTAFSGVFRPDENLPWLDAIHLGTNWYTRDTDFVQLLNQYHTASVPIYSETPYAMHTLFFGGIGMYYYEAGSLVVDSLVPFTSNISRMTRTTEGFTEYRMAEEMPGLLGANAEFTIHPDAPFNEDGILLLDALPEGETLIGYVVGGLESEFHNIFMLGGDSWASNKVYEVWLDKTGGLQTEPDPSDGESGWMVYPNPASGSFTIVCPAATDGILECTLGSMDGKLIRNYRTKTSGSETTLEIPGDWPTGNYLVRCTTGNSTFSAGLVVR